MVKNSVESRSNVTRDGGLHIHPKNVQGNRKLQDHLEQDEVLYHTYDIGKTDLKVVIRGPTDLKDIEERTPRHELPLSLSKLWKGMKRYTKLPDILIL